MQMWRLGGRRGWHTRGGGVRGHIRRGGCHRGWSRHKGGKKRGRYGDEVAVDFEFEFWRELK